jgi:hypothetical protein
MVNMAKHADTPKRKKLWAKADEIVNKGVPRKLLTKKNLAKIEAEAAKVEDGDLYKHLHRVGDDPVKGEIEQALSEMLDEKTFRRVVAVFKIATDDA